RAFCGVSAVATFADTNTAGVQCFSGGAARCGFDADLRPRRHVEPPSGRLVQLHYVSLHFYAGHCRARPADGKRIGIAGSSDCRRGCDSRTARFSGWPHWHPSRVYPAGALLRLYYFLCAEGGLGSPHPTGIISDYDGRSTNRQAHRLRGVSMYFEQFYLGCLAHASYMLGSEGEAAVVDPQRDVEIYLKAADEQGLKIRHIFETHLHADFVSGHLELAERTGAKIYIGAEAGATFPHVAMRDGTEVRFGKLRITALETPGHTPEGICLVVTD